MSTAQQQVEAIVRHGYRILGLKTPFVAKPPAHSVLGDGRVLIEAPDGSLLLDDHPDEQAVERYVEHRGKWCKEIHTRGELVFRYDNVDGPEL